MIAALMPAIECLAPEEGTLLQVVYLKKKNGTLLSFVGAAFDPNEFEEIVSIAPGELIEIHYAEPSEAHLAKEPSERSLQ
jgi:hypothetical protein